MSRRTWSAVVAGLTITLVLQAALLAAWWLPVFGRGEMQIIAHHGDVARWPENTLEAISSAVASDADGIEIDVLTSADGTWWVFHDEDVSQRTNQQGRFSTLTDAEVAQLRIVRGMGTQEESRRAFRVPRLADAMDVLGSYTGTLVLDVRVLSTSEYTEIARMFQGRDAVFICQTAEGARAVKGVDTRLRTAASPLVQPRDAIDYRLLDARTRIRAPWDLWLGDPALVYENGADYGAEDPEWFRRAETWGAVMYLTNHIDDAVRASAG